MYTTRPKNVHGALKCTGRVTDICYYISMLFWTRHAHTSRVGTLEKQVCIMNKSVKQNSDCLAKVKKYLSQLQMSVKNAAQNQLSADYENRLRIVENIVKQKK